MLLRSDIAVYGPSPKLRERRAALNLILRIYRAEQRYARLKASTGIVIEFFERDRSLTGHDARNLSLASAVNREITQLLHQWKQGRPGAGGARLIAGHPKPRQATQHQ